ncbi:MAG TPA: N-acyl homoserine lactonase family protein [Usitatibacter sp.]|nr:N-acyl homoserine lactonase family protein [Usitatibacter sp.]
MRFVKSLAPGLLAIAFAAPAFSQSPELTLTRFDCGTPQQPTDVNQRFSDTFAFPGVKVQFVYSCYLIRHGNDYMMWDTGFAADAGPTAPRETVPQQLAKIGVKAEEVKFVGISHYHGDHLGGVSGFPNATLLIGKGDWEGLTAAKPAPGANPALVAHWISGGGKVEPVPADKDVFGDGSVMMLYTPGHTPGHHSLLVKLAKMGPVILVGDAAHFHENYDTDGVPSFNYDRAQTEASIERIKKLAANLKATVVIQHDARDVSKLPVAPESAK